MICGGTFKRITDKHVQCMHGISLVEYKRTYEARVEEVSLPAIPQEPPPTPTAPGVFVPGAPPVPVAASPTAPPRISVSRGEILDSLADWITQDSQLTPLTHRVVETLLLDEGKRFSVVLRALAAAKLEKARDLLMNLDRVDYLLFDPMRLATASTADLIRIRQLLDTDLEATKNLLIHVAGEGPPPTVQNFNLNVAVDNRQVVVGGEEVSVPATGPERERLFRLAQQLRAIVKEPPVVISPPANGTHA